MRSIARIAGATLTLVLVLASIGLPGPHVDALWQPRAALAQPADDPVLLRELLERLLSPSFAPPGFEPQRVQVVLGGAPDGLPFTLPVPSGGRVIGSVVRTGGKGFGPTEDSRSIEVVIDAPGATAELAAFFEDAMGAQGWTLPADQPMGPVGGFQPSPSPRSLLFCQGDSRFFVSVNIFGRVNAPADVRVMVNEEEFSPCRTSPRPGPIERPPFDIIPRLDPPPGVQLFSTGGGGGPNTFAYDATADTALSVADLEAHYARQLEAAGWTRRDGEAGETLAWSTWTVPGEGDRRGFLYALAGAGNNRQLRVHATTGSNRPPFR